MMNHAEPPDPIRGDTAPTIDRIGTARRLLDLHHKVFVPEPACQWCLTRYPCDDAAWSIRVVCRAQLELGMEP